MQTFTFRKNPQLASRAGRISMSLKTPQQMQKHQTHAGNALLLQEGIGHYAAMGKLSAAARAKRARS